MENQIIVVRSINFHAIRIIYILFFSDNLSGKKEDFTISARELVPNKYLNFGIGRKKQNNKSWFLQIR